MEVTPAAASTVGYTARSTCRVCGSGDLLLVLDYGRMPLAGGFFEASDPRASETFPLHLVRCARCTLLQVLENVAPEKVFSQYSYASSYNRTLVGHFAGVAGELRALAGPDGLVVEFGCNDGILLRPLRDLGSRVVGVDPSDVARRASGEAGWPLYPAYFSAAVARQVRADHGPAAVVTAHNVCAHVDDPNDLVRGVVELLAPGGRFVFEVHYQGDLVEGHQYDTVYHEHTCYHSLTALGWLLGRHGLRVLDVRRIPIHAGSIHVTAGRAEDGGEPTEAVRRMLAEEARMDLAGFSRGVESRRRALVTLLGDLRRAGRRIVAYGASGRATVLLNYCGIGPEVVEHVSDLSPLRHGRVVPGVRVPVVPRSAFQEAPPDYALMTAWNYEKEIVADETRYLSSGGLFVVPLPDVRVVGGP